ncbi:hypothetical protein D3C75_771550 [compost metagenome]
MFASFIVRRDDLAEGDSSFHRLIVTDQVISQTLFGQGLPATDNLGGIIDLELVVFVLQQLLEAAADGTLFDGEHQHFVIDQ